MSRIILNNKSSAPDDIALAFVIDCIRAGRISNEGKQYCYATRYSSGSEKYILSSVLNESSDSFTLLDDNSVL